MLKKNVLFLVLMLSIGSAALADVPPESGNTYVSEALKITPLEDFSDYRFFLQSPMDVEEIQLKKGETFERVSGGGGAKNYVTLIAIPKKNLAAFEGKPSEEINRALRDKKIEGVIELVRHGFRKEVPESKRNGSFAKEYRIEKDSEKGLKVSSSGQSESSSIDDGNSAGIGSFGGSLRNIVLGALFAAVIFSIGLWFLSRKKKAA